MLCGLCLWFNLLRAAVLRSVSDERGLEDREQPVGLQTAEALDRLHYAGRGPTQRRPGVSPSLHVATDAAHGAQHVLDRVGAAERAPELFRQAEAVDGQYLVEPLKDAGGNGGRVLLEPTCEIAEQSLGLVGIVELPGLPKRAADRRMQRLRQPLDDVARLVDLTTLDRRVRAEAAADGFAQRLGAIDDEQPADLRVEPPRDQIVDQRLD